jgi:hypothetical protein
MLDPYTDEIAFGAEQFVPRKGRPSMLRPQDVSTGCLPVAWWRRLLVHPSDQ